jgi:hypothetical protein
MCGTSKGKSSKPDRRVSSLAVHMKTAMAAREHKTQPSLECRHGHRPHPEERVLHLVCPSMHRLPNTLRMIESFSPLLFTRHLLVFVRVILTLAMRNTVPAVLVKRATSTTSQQHKPTTVCHQLQTSSLTTVLTLLVATQSTILPVVHHTPLAHLLFLRLVSHLQMHSSTQHLLHH